MPAKELRIGNRTAYFRKAIRTPDFNSERVLARDAFEFAGMWLKRECRDALPYWGQAQEYFRASHTLSAQSSPLTLYYCFLNAAKALLTVKGVDFSDRHGVAGQFQRSKRALQNEMITFQRGGVIAALSKYLQETEEENEHSLKDVLSNLPFIHRSFRHTFRSHPEIFIPLRNVIYRKHPNEDYVWVTADLEGRFADSRSIGTLPGQFERDEGESKKFIVRAKKRSKWFPRGASKVDQAWAMDRLQSYHRKMRRDIVYISASPNLWYLKRSVSDTRRLNRYGLTLIMAAMHRLSELSRYDPAGLAGYLDRKENWLLTEFIDLAPAQFMDELVCEMTSLEFALPGVRPKST